MKTSELTGTALDWAVSKAEGFDYFGEFLYAPSQLWEQGGLIIEGERIGIDCDDQGVWFASYDLSAETARGATGTTPLIAAMRAYVASKLGEDIEVPAELNRGHQ